MQAQPGTSDRPYLTAPGHTEQVLYRFGMSGSKFGLLARIGGLVASWFLKGKDKQKSEDISNAVGDAADAIDEQTHRR